MDEALRLQYQKKFLRYGLSTSSGIIVGLNIDSNVDERISKIIRIWDDIEVRAKQDELLYERFKEINKIFFCGIVATILKHMRDGKLKPIDTIFQDSQKAYSGFAEANVILGGIATSAMDATAEINVYGMALIKLKETHEVEILNLLSRYNGGVRVSNDIIYPHYAIDGRELIQIIGTPKIINIHRIRNGLSHSRITINTNTIKITDVNRSGNYYEIIMSHSFFKRLVFYYYSIIGLICALNDLINLICHFEIPFGPCISDLLIHMRQRGYSVPKPNWDKDEV